MWQHRQIGLSLWCADFLHQLLIVQHTDKGHTHQSLNININVNSKTDSFVCSGTYQGLYTRRRVSGCSPGSGTAPRLNTTTARSRLQRGNPNAAMSCC